jgi:DNA-binding helix-hairpin-helix protein with protein kinase domain
MTLSTPSFERGRSVRLLASGFEAEVDSVLGMGGQGTVYRVNVAGSLYALKWYHPHYLPQDIRLRERLSQAIARGNPDGRFLWPIELVEADNERSFGYLMLIRPTNFRSSRHLLGSPAHRIDPPLVTRTMACLNIAESFLQLHAKGLCYQDISLGNLFLDPASGGVCICDNDNVDVNGMPGAIYGTKKFMAPEIVRREGLPNTATDLYSMAVLFFYLLHSWHPLDGRREAEVMMMDPDEELKLYGTRPLFLFDEDDRSNGPISGMHDPVARRWGSLSEALRRLFTRSFTAGINPARRVVETEWLSALSRMNDNLVTCPKCHYEHALNIATAADNVAGRFFCVACRSAIPVPSRLVIGKESIALAPSRALYPHHLRNSGGYSFNQAAAIVQPHPADARVLGLRNMTANAWSAKLPDGRTATVEPGKSIRVVPGLSLDFGQRRGTIV